MFVTIRQEHDALGRREVPADALHGIHTLRALENFGLLGRPVHPGLARALGITDEDYPTVIGKKGMNARLIGQMLEAEIEVQKISEYH